VADIHVYKGEVTSGGVDGILVSEGGANTSPIIVGPLNGNNNEVSESLKLSIRCDPDFLTIGETLISILGLTASKWALALDNEGVPGIFKEYGETLVIPGIITDVNTIFWTKAKSDTFDIKPDDSYVSFNVQAEVRKV